MQLGIFGNPVAQSATVEHVEGNFRMIYAQLLQQSLEELDEQELMDSGKPQGRSDTKSGDPGLRELQEELAEPPYVLYFRVWEGAASAEYRGTIVHYTAARRQGLHSVCIRCRLMSSDALTAPYAFVFATIGPDGTATYADRYYVQDGAMAPPQDELVRLLTSQKR